MTKVRTPRKHLKIVMFLVSALAATAAVAQTYEPPKAISTLGLPLVLHMAVSAPAGQRLAIPCVRMDGANKYSFWRTSQNAGVVEINTNRVAESSPTHVTLLLGCQQPNPVTYAVVVAPTPVTGVVGGISRTVPPRAVLAEEPSNVSPSLILDRVREMSSSRRAQ